MARYAIGQPVRISTTVRDVTGTLINATTVTLTVLKPDATQQSYASPVNDSTGMYHQDVPTTDLILTGHYQYKWVSTGTGAGVSPIGELDVFDPFVDVQLMALQDAKDELNIAQSDTSSDIELQAKIDTIQSALERFTGGPIINRQIVERVEITSRLRTLVLLKRPLVSVQSIVSVASGAALSTADLDLDTNSNIIRRKLGLPFVIWWYGTVIVTYTAGWGTSAPPAFNEAARIIIGHQWATQRGPAVRPNMDEGSPPDSVLIPGTSYAIPRRAWELLLPYGSEAYF
jgi:hypothetical protein